MQLTEEIKEKIKEHCWKDSTNEACGLILKNKDVIPCVNRASDSDVHFIINHGDIKKAQKIAPVIAVYHSHIKTKDEDDGLSSEDIILAEYFDICFVLYSLTKDEFFVYSPVGKPVGYTDRPYVRSVFDEFVLVKDYYKKELNVEININSKNHETFLKTNGFSEVDGPQKHDILILKPKKKDLRLGIYTQTDKILVQPEFEVSSFINYTYGLKRWTEKIYRHNSLL